MKSCLDPVVVSIRTQSFMVLHDSNLFYTSVSESPATILILVVWQITNKEAKRPCPFETRHYAKNTGTSGPVCECDCNKRTDMQTTQRPTTNPSPQHSSRLFFTRLFHNTLQQHYSLRPSVQEFSTANTSLQHSTPQNHHDTTTAQTDQHCQPTPPHHKITATEAKHHHITKSPRYQENTITPARHHYTTKSAKKHQHQITPKSSFADSLGIRKRKTWNFRPELSQGQYEIQKSYWRFFYNIVVDVITIKS